MKAIDDVRYAVNLQLGNAYDNLIRARVAARSHAMLAPYGESGQTLREIIEGYADEVVRWQAAIDWLDTRKEAA